MSASKSIASGTCLLQHLGVIGGVLARGIGVEVAADILDLGRDRERRAPLVPLNAMCSSMCDTPLIAIGSCRVPIAT